MVNRVLQVKVLKIKRRRMKLQGKFTSTQIEKDRARPTSLSKQIINVGLRVPGMTLKGPLDKAAYQFNNPKKRDLVSELPKTLGISLERELALKLSALLSISQDLGLHNCIIKTPQTRIYVFFDSQMKDVYLVRISFTRNTVDRSINYRTVAAAQEAALLGNVVWRRHNPQ